LLSAAAASAAMSGGVSGCRSSTAGGGVFRCMLMSAIALSAVNGSAPVSIRKRMTPNE
jgi:hypothetical protein